MFTIYSIGDSAFLAQILNALAMICGTGDFKTLVGIGALLGLFVMGFQCLTSGTRQFNLHQVLIGIICYMCFFGPAVTVQIEDAYTDEVRVVDNVPLGAAAAGTMISNIGYGVTSLFEQGYGTADRMTEHAFLEPLKVVTGVRSAARDISIIEAAGKSTGNPSLAQDIDNYLRECTMVKIAIGESTPDAMYRGGTNELFYNSNVYGTHLSGAGDVTCAEATQYIRQGLDLLGQQDAATALNRLLNIKENGQTAPHMDKVDNALQMLDAVGNNGTQYLQIAVLEPLYEKAVAGFYKDLGDASAAVMVNQAIEQRNMQWAAEGSMFVSTMRPLMAFFEGFIYAITPLVGFLLVVGAFGMNLLTKYFQVVIWIQLWMPVMSIINLYVSMAARNEFASLVTTPISFYTLNTGSQALQTWLGIGGMLTAATPMIALFLVTGSTYAFTALAGRMGGADHVNERIGSPDMLKPGGFLQQADHFKSDQVTGTTGVGYTAPTYALSSGLNSAISQLNSKIATQADTAIQQAAVNNATGKVDAVTRSINESTGQFLEANHQDTFNAIKSELAAKGALAGKNDQEVRQAVGQAAVQLAAQAGAKGGYEQGRSIEQTTQRKSRPDGGDMFSGAPWPKDLQNIGQQGPGGVGGPVPTGSPAPTQDAYKNITDMENALHNSKGLSRGVDAGLTATVTGSGSRSLNTQSGENRQSNVNQSFGSNLSKGDATAIADAARYGVQYTAGKQSSENQTHTDSSGLSSTISSIRQNMDSYSKLQTMQKNASGTESRTLAEWTNTINGNAQSREMFRNISSQISGDAAVKRNAMENEFKRQGYRSDVAHDMANFQVIGQFESLGGEAQKAQIAAMSTGISGDMGLANPKELDSVKIGPQTINHDAVKSHIKGAVFDENRHSVGMEEPLQKVQNGVADVQKAGENFMNATGNVAHAQREQMRGQIVSEAMNRLFTEPNASTAQEFMGMFAKFFPSGTYSDQMQELESRGFTHAQANAMLDLRHSEDLRDANGNLTKNGQALHDEVRSQLGGDKADPKAVEATFNQMVKHLDAAADAHAPGKAMPVLAYNDAIQGLGRISSSSYQATDKSGAYFDYGTVQPRSEPVAQPEPKQEKVDTPTQPAEIAKNIRVQDEENKKLDHMDNVYKRLNDRPDN